MTRESNSELFSVSPKNMVFYAPYDRTQKRIITILNPTMQKLLFKILTNAPWQYNAIPKCGCVEPYDISEILISLNGFQFNHAEKYCHRFCVQCIPVPPAKLFDTQSILCLFKRVRRGMIHNVRVPVELKPKPLDIPQDELDSILQYDVQKLLWHMRPIDADYLEQLKQVTMPAKGRKKRCGWKCMLVTPLILIWTGLAVGEHHNRNIDLKVML